MAEHDPDAAEMLLQQVQIEEQAASQEKSDPMARVLHMAYDPLELYARVARIYGWTFREMDGMDYVQFFAMVDKTAKILNEERQTPKSEPIMTEAEMRAWLPPARKYEGPTVAIR